MREWVCPYCGWKTTTKIDRPGICGNLNCGNRELKLIEKNDECEICSSKNSVNLLVHHILPKSLGGNDDEDNKIIVCSSCHTKIHDELKRKIKEWTEDLKPGRIVRRETELSADTYTELI